MRFPVRIACKEDGCTVTFPDIPEAITCGHDRAEALANAVEALESALDFYFEDHRPVPTPSAPKRGQVLVEVPAGTAAKVLLLNELLAQNVRPIDLARKLHVTKSEVTRILDLRHHTKIDTIAAALAILGKHLELRAV